MIRWIQRHWKGTLAVIALTGAIALSYEPSRSAFYDRLNLRPVAFDLAIAYLMAYLFHLLIMDLPARRAEARLLQSSGDALESLASSAMNLLGVIHDRTHSGMPRPEAYPLSLIQEMSGRLSSTTPGLSILESTGSRDGSWAEMFIAWNDVHDHTYDALAPLIPHLHPSIGGSLLNIQLSPWRNLVRNCRGIPDVQIGAVAGTLSAYADLCAKLDTALTERRHEAPKLRLRRS